jgi:hypothetical protein
MADRLTQFSGGWLLLALWVGLLGLGAIMEHTPRALLPVGAVLAFVGLYLGYPLLLVFASRAIPSTPKARAFVLACCVLVCVCLTGEVFSSETVAQWFSGFGMVGVLGVQFSAVHVLVEKERQHGLYELGCGFKAWLCFFYLPFFGLIFLLRRHRKLVELSSAAQVAA